MDIDRYIALNQPTWDRLGALTARAGRTVRSLSPSELDELVRLYQRVSAHLSYARTYYRDPSLTATLTRLVARAGAVVYGTQPRSLRAVGRFFADSFPAAVWHATVPPSPISMSSGCGPKTSRSRAIAAYSLLIDSARSRD